MGRYDELEVAERELKRGEDPEIVALRMSAAEEIMSEIHVYRDDVRFEGGLGDIPAVDLWLENNPHLLPSTDSENEYVTGGEQETERRL